MLITSGQQKMAAWVKQKAGNGTCMEIKLRTGAATTGSNYWNAHW
jgi:hypothetical protein